MGMIIIKQNQFQSRLELAFGACTRDGIRLGLKNVVCAGDFNAQRWPLDSKWKKINRCCRCHEKEILFIDFKIAWGRKTSG